MMIKKKVRGWIMSDTLGTVYLAGPHEKAHDPEGWRNWVVENSEPFDFHNPADLDWTKGENDDEMIETCKAMVRDSDGMLIRFMEGQETCGTWHEQQIAWKAEIPCVLVTDIPEDEIYTFAKHHSYRMVTTIGEGLEILARII